MNTAEHVSDRHRDDGTLLRFLDEECDPDERADLTAHLTECGACRARLEALRALSAAVTQHLAGDDAVRRAAVRRVPILRAAAVVLLVGAAAASAQPIGRWIARLAGPTAPAPAGAAGHPTTGDSTGAAPAGARISFAPQGATLDVVFRAAQPTGTLTLAPSGDSRAAFGVANRAVPPGVTVLPSGLVIANTPADSGSYRITVPSSVTAISLQVAGRIVERITWRPADGARTIALTAAPR